ncbi:SDR family oxidoreductase [Psychrobacillus sp. FSL W7-1493]|uniref:SDR family oxidoreductase n=1 Tax=Psychrobacillus sp. FSL W7-1493 TaxID=2921552 RepID=UPI0030FA2EAB
MNKKIAIVTGASNQRDIGTAICRKLATKGIDIFFTYWKAESEWIQQFQQEINNLGVRCVGLDIDLSASEAYALVLNAVEEQLGKPSILVNNAAHSTNDGYLNLDSKTIDDHYAVNMRTVFLLSAEFAKRFKNSELRSGRIINMTSGQELGPMPGELAYAATKAAITAFTKSLSTEVAPLGITVNAVNPGPTDSTWMTEEIREHLLPKFPMGRIGQPKDVAESVAFLASDEAAWITGQVIHSEGGFVRG